MSDIPMAEQPDTNDPFPPPLEDRPFGRQVLGFWSPAGVSARVALTVAAAVSCLIFAAACRIFSLPALPGFDGSLFLQVSPAAAFVIIAVLILVTTLIGTVLAGAIHFEAGLFAAAFGLMIVSLRCGTIQSVLFETGGKSSVYFRLFIELILLGLIIAVAWLMLWQLARTVHGADSSMQPSNVTLLDGLTATAAQIVITAVIVLVLCQAATKNQCLASVGIASMIGSILAHKYAPARPSFWFWVGPLIVGSVGYALAATGQVSNLATGTPAGMFAPLARPLPVDYASIGVAGAIFGYWIARKPSPAN
jgi:hypothetical protein